MKALIDGDILRYELGFAAEAGWRHVSEDPEELPPWRYVSDLLDLRLEYILDKVGADDYQLYITEGRTFRFDLAKTKPYKGTRVEKKPWHFENLTTIFKDVLNAKVITYIEADDALAVDHLASGGQTTLVSRDKDLRQCPGRFFSWELGSQPSFGPVEITGDGDLTITDKPLKLLGTGFKFFAAQVIMGDPVDNIPGLPKYGPRAAMDKLGECRDAKDCTAVLCEEYQRVHGHEWEEHLLEQGQLCWVTRRLNEDSSPVLWEIGMTE